MPKFSEEITQNFCEAVKNAKAEDITYSKKSVPVHFDIDDKKTGFRPIEVAGVPTPSTIRVSYVEGCDSKGKYWYVISWTGTEEEQPKEYESNSEDEAKMAVLNELKRYIES
ncbi:MAG: hypothetical protein GY795_17475 [Desulfobacterales bacterium]|nr:hypothetical protein [Desulfobacterales bacterium]